MTPLVEKWAYHVSAQMRARIGAGWRERCAFALRRAADRLDARTSVAYAIVTQPELPRAAITECLTIGAQSVTRAIHESLRDQATERIFRQVSPGWLFADKGEETQ